MPYAQAATRLVLDPLGMRDSRFPARAADIARPPDIAQAPDIARPTANWPRLASTCTANRAASGSSSTMRIRGQCFPMLIRPLCPDCRLFPVASA